MAQYKVKLSLTELYETVIEADSELEALKIADNMDIEEFNETGQLEQNYLPLIPLEGVIVGVERIGQGQ
jgi:hypothetical protein